jgi:hypothetical protein
MPLTLRDIIPIGLCITTQWLLDTKRFRENFCDHLILRDRDPSLAPRLGRVRKELTSLRTEKGFLPGHKMVIIGCLDEILARTSHFATISPQLTEAIRVAGKELIERVLRADSFEQIAALEPTFKTKITLPVYELFLRSRRRDVI